MAFELRWAEGRTERLPALADELVRPSSRRDRHRRDPRGTSGQGGDYEHTDRLSHQIYFHPSVGTRRPAPAPSPVSAAQLVAMPVHLGLPILGIPLVHHGAVIEAQELRRPGVWQQEPHHLLIPGKYLQDHSSNPLATGYAEIAQNSFADALMLGAREASVLM